LYGECLEQKEKDRDDSRDATLHACGMGVTELTGSLVETSAQTGCRGGGEGNPCASLHLNCPSTFANLHLN
jgi:hypothetical protein